MEKLTRLYLPPALCRAGVPELNVALPLPSLAGLAEECLLEASPFSPSQGSCSPPPLQVSLLQMTDARVVRGHPRLPLVP